MCHHRRKINDPSRSGRQLRDEFVPVCLKPHEYDELVNASDKHSLVVCRSAGPKRSGPGQRPSVAVVVRVPDEDAAVAVANDSAFGTGGWVVTQDIERGKRVARRIDTGMVFINAPASSSPELPFGGVKNSGYGRELSGAGIQEFVNKKLIRVV